MQVRRKLTLSILLLKRFCFARVALLLLAVCGTLLASPTYDGCEECHGDFDFGTYVSLQDGTNWGTDLMDGHLAFVSENCLVCHNFDSSSEVFINESMHGTLSRSCVGCHGRDEDVTGNCTGEAENLGGVEVQCGSGAGLRAYHEARLGPGTCSSCHDGDAVPVGEHILPFNYGHVLVDLLDSCDGDGTESRFGPTGLDNDGDGQRDENDPDCQQQAGFTINAGLNDAWFNPATAGQGFFLTVFEDIQMMFVAWFTYDTGRPDDGVMANLGEPGHRWLTAFGPYDGDTAELDVELTRGGVFDSPEPAVMQSADGAIVVEFAGCNEALVTYDITSAGVSGVVPIERIALDNVALCEVGVQSAPASDSGG